ncbi:MAG: hypothetical protein HRT44_00595 [Bdellovibrionales bacterium]|nr:hypothetical protein [Bdellovibrionales bacterium]NQZ17749.1 hypothetical protein [Bdellovibrionales bacterium]
MAHGANSCGRTFQRLEVHTSKDIGFSQNFLGFHWAALKLEKLTTKFLEWAESGNSSNKQEYVLWKTQREPLPAYRDINGSIKINDRHHTFHAYTRFMGSNNFNVHVRILKDYRGINPATGKNWKKKDESN